jgi:hypothetical protein
MKSIDKTCKNCVHEKDLGSEYCGSCTEPDNWSEALWHFRQRIIEVLKVLETVLLDVDGKISIDGSNKDKIIITHGLKRMHEILEED